MKRYLELPKGIPFHDTIQRFFILRPDELQKMLVTIAADGKKIRNTARKNNPEVVQSRNPNEFNVMSTEWGLCLSSTRINEKSNEIPEMQRVIKQIDCRSCIVTEDVMNTKTAAARAIAKETHDEYCLVLKENQKTA